MNAALVVYENPWSWFWCHALNTFDWLSMEVFVRYVDSSAFQHTWEEISYLKWQILDTGICLQPNSRDATAGYQRVWHSFAAALLGNQMFSFQHKQNHHSNCTVMGSSYGCICSTLPWRLQAILQPTNDLCHVSAAPEILPCTLREPKAALYLLFKQYLHTTSWVFSFYLFDCEPASQQTWDLLC